MHILRYAAWNCIIFAACALEQIAQLHVHTCNHFQGEQSVPCEKEEVPDELHVADYSSALPKRSSFFQHSSTEQNNSPEGIESRWQVSFLDAR